MIDASCPDSLQMRLKLLHKKLPGGVSKVEKVGKSWYGTYSWAPDQQDLMFVGSECPLI